MPKVFRMTEALMILTEPSMKEERQMLWRWEKE
jgi:hypothetical protein